MLSMGKSTITGQIHYFYGHFSIAIFDITRGYDFNGEHDYKPFNVGSLFSDKHIWTRELLKRLRDHRSVIGL